MTGYNTRSYCNVFGYMYVTSHVIINMTKCVDCRYLLVWTRTILYIDALSVSKQRLFEFRIHRLVPTGIPARGRDEDME